MQYLFHLLLFNNAFLELLYLSANPHNYQKVEYLTDKVTKSGSWQPLRSRACPP